MKSASWCSFLLVGIMFAVSPYIAVCAQLAKSADKVSGDELAVYDAFLNRFDKNGHFLIADTTSTFVCDGTGSNGFSMGGCNGLRGANESPSERLSIVKRDVPELQTETMATFEERNQRSVSIPRAMSTTLSYYLLTDSSIPKDWKYSYLVYFSRVGFNVERTQALVAVGLVSATNAKDSRGQYFFLKKRDEKWVLDGSSAIWELVTKE